MPGPDDERDARFWNQYEVVRAAASRRGITIDHEWSPGRDRETQTPDLIFEQDALLIPRRNLPMIAGKVSYEIVDDRGVRSTRVHRDEGDDTLYLRLAGGERAPDVLDFLRGPINRLTPEAVRPNHLISICGGCMCPATEPLPPSEGTGPQPPQAADDAGAGVFVHVVDTGVWDGFQRDHPWFDDAAGDLVTEVDGDPRWGRLAEVTGNSRSGSIVDGIIGEYVGHGVFIAGVLRCLAPGTRVFVSNALAWAGAVMEDTLGQDLVNGLTVAAEDRPDIISLSAGSATFDDLPHLGLQAFFDELNQDDCATLLVAAAGNDGEAHKFFPAAMAVDNPDTVVGVGALRGDGLGRACFSNYGDWVSVYAPGERMINAFLTGTYRYIDPQRVSEVSHDVECRYYQPAIYQGCTCLNAPVQGSEASFDGMTEWSGTSFATPYVVGRIVRHMTETGETNARVAARSLMGTLRPLTDAAPDQVVLGRIIT